MELGAYGIDLPTLRRMYEEWKGGAPKSELERRYLGKPGSHGKLFSSLVRRHLGIETERSHPLVKENERLTLRVEELEKENRRLRNQQQLDL